MSEWPHGDPRRYWSGCRCDVCRAANTAYRAEHRRAKREESSKYPFYTTWCIHRPCDRKTPHRFYRNLGSAQKALAGFAKATEGIVKEPIDLYYADLGGANQLILAWKIRPGTPVADLPWRKK